MEVGHFLICDGHTRGTKCNILYNTSTITLSTLHCQQTHTQTYNESSHCCLTALNIDKCLYQTTSLWSMGGLKLKHVTSCKSLHFTSNVYAFVKQSDALSCKTHIVTQSSCSVCMVTLSPYIIIPLLCSLPGTTSNMHFYYPPVDRQTHEQLCHKMCCYMNIQTCALTPCK